MREKRSAPRSNSSNYWHANLRLVGVLLTIWFITSFVISIFFIETFNTIKIGSLGLGFWFAQQGSILVFVLLVLTYALGMDVVDRRYHVDQGSRDRLKDSDQTGERS